MGNKSGRNIVVEKQPKDGSTLNPGSFVKQVSPSKLKASRKPPPNAVSSVAKLPTTLVDSSVSQQPIFVNDKGKQKGNSKTKPKKQEDWLVSALNNESSDEESDEVLELEDDKKLPASQGSQGLHEVNCLSSDEENSSVEDTKLPAKEVAAIPPQPRTVAASYPSDGSLSSTDVPKVYKPRTLSNKKKREALLDLEVLSDVLKGCCKDYKKRIAVMEDAVKMSEGITNKRWYLSEDLEKKIQIFRTIRSYEEQLEYVPELHQCVKENVATMMAKTSFSDSSESEKESRDEVMDARRKKKNEALEKIQLVKKKENEDRMNEKKEARKLKAKVAKKKAKEDKAAKRKARERKLLFHRKLSAEEAYQFLCDEGMKCLKKDKLVDIVCAFTDINNNRQFLMAMKDDPIGLLFQDVHPPQFGYQSLEEMEFEHVPVLGGIKTWMCAVFHKP